MEISILKTYFYGSLFEASDSLKTKQKTSSPVLAIKDDMSAAIECACCSDLRCAVELLNLLV